MPELSRAGVTLTVACLNLLDPYGIWGDPMSRGFADLHNHQFAHLGFGGMAFWGGAHMQGDGNLVIYRTDGTTAWATNTVQP